MLCSIWNPETRVGTLATALLVRGEAWVTHFRLPYSIRAWMPVLEDFLPSFRRLPENWGEYQIVGAYIRVGCDLGWQHDACFLRSAKNARIGQSTITAACIKHNSMHRNNLTTKETNYTSKH